MQEQKVIPKVAKDGRSASEEELETIGLGEQVCFQVFF